MKQQFPMYFRINFLFNIFSFLIKFEPIRRELEIALQKKMKNSPYAKMIVETISDNDCPELSQANSVLREQMIDTVYELVEDPNSPMTR